MTGTGPRPETRRFEVPAATAPTREPLFSLEDLSVSYGAFQAIGGVTLDIRPNEITAFIGPSGCGKTTLLRCLNRMNDLIESARVEGSVRYHGVDLYGPRIDPVEVRWPNGLRERWMNVEVNKVQVLTEGTGTAVPR